MSEGPQRPAIDPADHLGLIGCAIRRSNLGRYLSREDYEDLRQHLFIQLHKICRDYRADRGTEFPGWASYCLKRKAWGWWKENRRKAGVQDRSKALWVEMGARCSEVEREPPEWVPPEDVDKFLAPLNPVDRLIVRYRLGLGQPDGVGLSAEEVGARVGMNRNLVSLREKNAYTKLRRLFGEGGAFSSNKQRTHEREG